MIGCSVVCLAEVVVEVVVLGMVVVIVVVVVVVVVIVAVVVVVVVKRKHITISLCSSDAVVGSEQNIITQCDSRHM